MNKKGFTLVELLSVISILAVISVMASAGVMKLYNNSKENMYCAKIKMIETEAEEYAIKYERELNESDNLYNGYKSLTIKINDLVENGNIEANKDNNIINPIDNSIMNNIDIIIYLKNNQINAYIDNNICEN